MQSQADALPRALVAVLLLHHRERTDMHAYPVKHVRHAHVQDPEAPQQLSDDEADRVTAVGAAPAPSSDTALVAGALTMLATSPPEAPPVEDVAWMSSRRYTVENDPAHRQFLLDVLQAAGGGRGAHAAAVPATVDNDILQLAQVRLPSGPASTAAPEVIRLFPDMDCRDNHLAACMLPV